MAEITAQSTPSDCYIEGFLRAKTEVITDVCAHRDIEEVHAAHHTAFGIRTSHHSLLPDTQPTHRCQHPDTALGVSSGGKDRMKFDWSHTSSIDESITSRFFLYVVLGLPEEAKHRR